MIDPTYYAIGQSSALAAVSSSMLLFLGIPSGACYLLNVAKFLKSFSRILPQERREIMVNAITQTKNIGGGVALCSFIPALIVLLSIRYPQHLGAISMALLCYIILLLSSYGYLFYHLLSVTTNELKSHMEETRVLTANVNNTISSNRMKSSCKNITGENLDPAINRMVIAKYAVVGTSSILVPVYLLFLIDPYIQRKYTYLMLIQFFTLLYVMSTSSLITAYRQYYPSATRLLSSSIKSLGSLRSLRLGSSRGNILDPVKIHCERAQIAEV